MIIKLSSLHLGDVLKLTWPQINKKEIIVLTDLLKYENADTKEFSWFDIKGRKLFIFSDLSLKPNFNLNHIKERDILSDTYDMDLECSTIPLNELPLLINEEKKTVWFDKTLNGNLTNIGLNYHTQMLKELGYYPFTPTSS